MKNNKDILLQLGHLAFATRLKRISDALMNDVSKLYKQHHVNFEARWFTLMYLLSKQKETSVVDAANSLGLSHVAIIQIIEQLKKNDLIISHQSKEDARKHLISLSEKGRNILNEISPLLKKIEKANKVLTKEVSDDFFKNLSNLEKALKKKSMFERVNELK